MKKFILLLVVGIAIPALAKTSISVAADKSDYPKTECGNVASIDLDENGVVTFITYKTDRGRTRVVRVGEALGEKVFEAFIRGCKVRVCVEITLVDGKEVRKIISVNISEPDKISFDSNEIDSAGFDIMEEGAGYTIEDNRTTIREIETLDSFQRY
jgi:hypothetical protein